ncbi:Rv0361 family membrane protein [Tsukamurella soli]|uniref:SnoaL-like domain-containing protein n=1 Tax=Tsukamurella soli TaxID=644556 RepID=A0ABP8K198_9ACTN
MTRADAPNGGTAYQHVGGPVYEYPVLSSETYRRLGIPEPSRPGQAPPPPPGTALVTGTRSPYMGYEIPTHVAGTPWRTAPTTPAAKDVPRPGPAPSGPAPSGPAPSGPAPSGPAPSGPGAGRSSGPSTPLIVGVTTAIVVLIIVVAAAIVVTVILGRQGTDTDAIRSTITAENDAYNDRDFQAMLATHCTADVATLQSRYTEQTFAASVDARVGPSGTWAVTVSDITVDRADGTATATEAATPSATAAGLDSQPMTVTEVVALRKESGRWKLCLSDANN